MPKSNKSNKTILNLSVIEYTVSGKINQYNNIKIHKNKNINELFILLNKSIKLYNIQYNNHIIDNNSSLSSNNIKHNDILILVRKTQTHNCINCNSNNTVTYSITQQCKHYMCIECIANTIEKYYLSMSAKQWFVETSTICILCNYM